MYEADVLDHTRRCLVCRVVPVSLQDVPCQPWNAQPWVDGRMRAVTHTISSEVLAASTFARSLPRPSTRPPESPSRLSAEWQDSQTESQCTSLHVLNHRIIRAAGFGMDDELSSLFSERDHIDYCAPVATRAPARRPHRILVISRDGREAALLVVEMGPIIKIAASLPLYLDVISRTTQLSAGFQCEFYAQDLPSSPVLVVQISDIAVLQELLQIVKKFVALADDLGLHSRGRSHGWVATYQPATRDNTLSKQDDPNNPGDLDDTRSVASTTTVSAVTISDDATSTLTNDRFFASSRTHAPSGIHGQNVHERKEHREQHIHAFMADRKDEYTDSHSLLVKCSTWNMAGTDLVESLSTLLKEPEDDPVKLYCLAFQEVDLSAEAYLTTTDTKAQTYHSNIESAIGDYYELIASHQLVGMLLCVYAHKSIVPTISEVAKSYVPCGILGMIGNKGGVGIRFKVMHTSFAIVNCHLAAGQGGSDKRNSNLHDIEKKIFNESGVWDSGISGIENVVFLGDLNYRISADRPEVDSMLESRDLKTLLKYDQLGDQRKLGYIFEGWHEGPITFDPTYKFDTGTDHYDSSEKQRIPSWTDRILVRSEGDTMTLVEDSYKSVTEYYQSDHKPVSAKFRAQVEVVLTDKRDEIRNQAFKEVDRHENEAIPNIKVRTGEDELEFGDVYHLRPIARRLTIVNNGTSTARFSFSRNPVSNVLCKPWFWPVPLSGTLATTKQEVTIIITAFVNDRDAATLNSGRDQFSDVLILHVEGGKDSYVTLAGTWQPTSIGQPLAVLSSCRGVRTPTTKLTAGEISSIPIEIHRICDYLTTQTPFHSSGLFARHASKEALDSLQDALDTNSPFDDDPSLDGEDIVLALGNLLLAILNNLEEPIVPRTQYEEIMKNMIPPPPTVPVESKVSVASIIFRTTTRGAKRNGAAAATGPAAAATTIMTTTRMSPWDYLDAMPSAQLNVLIYLQGFMTSSINAHHHAGLEAEKLRQRMCRAFGDVLMRDDDDDDDDSAVRGRSRGRGEVDGAKGGHEEAEERARQRMQFMAFLIPFVE